jgi:hypothetical protein
MKWLIRLAARIYPRAWRERYGEEFEALLDEVQQRKRIASVALVVSTAVFVATRWAGQRPYISPGTHLVFDQDSNLGGLVGFLVTITAAAGGLVSWMLNQHGRSRAASRVRWASACTFILYLAGVVLVSLVTPRTIVSIGDSYCYDLWCIGIQRVNATPKGQDILYTAEVRVFSAANWVPTSRENSFLYAVDEQGRRFPLY